MRTGLECRGLALIIVCRAGGTEWTKFIIQKTISAKFVTHVGQYMATLSLFGALIMETGSGSQLLWL